MKTLLWKTKILMALGIALTLMCSLPFLQDNGPDACAVAPFVKGGFFTASPFPAGV